MPVKTIINIDPEQCRDEAIATAAAMYQGLGCKVELTKIDHYSWSGLPTRYALKVNGVVV